MGRKKPIKLGTDWKIADKLKNDRTFNSAGMYTDEFGNIHFTVMKMIIIGKIISNCIGLKIGLKNWISNIALHYTTGKGYFEQYKEDEKFSSYNLPNFEGNTRTDLVRKRWLDNDFFGTTFSINYKNQMTNVLFGGAVNRYLGQSLWRSNLDAILCAQFKSIL